jgi:hypothetical protein
VLCLVLLRAFLCCVQVLGGLAALSDKELEAGGSDKRSHEPAAGYAAVRKQALSCSLQVCVLCGWLPPMLVLSVV